MEDLSHYNPEGSTLRRAQLRMLDILLEVDRICKKHDIPYWIESGTLLGAVRHGGFIPWDDDLDIATTMEGYEKMKEFLPKELPEKFVLQNTETDKNVFVTFAKVRDKHSFLYEPIWHKTKEQGIYIDIFPFEPMFSIRYKRFIEYIFGNSYMRYHRRYDTKWKYVTGCVLIPFATLFMKISRLLFRLGPQKYLYTCCGTPFYWQTDTESLFPLQPILFEGHWVMGPKDPHAYLTSYYGDYMQLPPEEKRGGQHASKIEFYD